MKPDNMESGLEMNHASLDRPLDLPWKDTKRRSLRSKRCDYAVEPRVAGGACGRGSGVEPSPSGDVRATNFSTSSRRMTGKESFSTMSHCSTFRWVSLKIIWGAEAVRWGAGAPSDPDPPLVWGSSRPRPEEGLGLEEPQTRGGSGAPSDPDQGRVWGSSRPRPEEGLGLLQTQTRGGSGAPSDPDQRRVWGSFRPRPGEGLGLLQTQTRGGSGAPSDPDQRRVWGSSRPGPEEGLGQRSGLPI
ncbi:unnamed protein product [Boreogadus saida]